MKKIIVLFLFLMSNGIGSIYSQSSNISGTYCIEYALKDSSTCITFNDNGIFEEVSSGCVGVDEYGKGHYFITKDSLIMNYDLTDIKIKGYHILKPYSNRKDTIELKIKVFDFDKNPLSGVEFLLISKKIPIKTTNEKGELSYKLPLKKENGNILAVSDYSSYLFSYDGRWSYEMEVYLSKISDFEMGRAIKGFINKYKVIEIKKDFLLLGTKAGGRMTLKKY